MDSAGYIRVLNSDYGSSWIQICDTKCIARGKSDHYFMVGANLQEFIARCILVKGSRFPATVPRPVISVLPLKLALCGTENEKFTNEQNYWKSKIMGRAIDNMAGLDVPVIVTKEEIELIENESLIKLFAHACQLEQEARAMDVCKLMTFDSLQLGTWSMSSLHKCKQTADLSRKQPLFFKNVNKSCLFIEKCKQTAGHGPRFSISHQICHEKQEDAACHQDLSFGL